MSNRPAPDQPAPGENDQTIVDKPVESNLETDATIKDSTNTGEFAATIKDAATGAAVGSGSGSELSAGNRFGRYEVKKELGRGAMGAVYLALDVQLDREVAIKIPMFGPEDGPEDVERFYREARAMATLSHPNLCPVYDVGEIDGVHYLTMQFVEGRPMDDFLKGGKSHPAKQVAAVMRKLAVALEEAHQAGVVHRDLKPANIMLDKRNEPIIMDFGLAQRRKENETTLTQAGQIMGTPSYMSPEQVKGKQDAIGPPSDVYALGVICYQLLTGKLPFSGSLGEVMAAILTEEPEPPSKLNKKVDRSIEAICLKAMAKDIAERHASAADLAKSLRDYLRGKRLPEEDAKLALPRAVALEPTATVNTTGREVALADDFFADLVTAEAQAPATSPLGSSSFAQLTPAGRRTTRSKVPNRVWIAIGSGVGVLLLLILVIAIASSGGSDEDNQRAAKTGSDDGKTRKPVAKTAERDSEPTIPPVVTPQPNSTPSDGGPGYAQGVPNDGNYRLVSLGEPPYRQYRVSIKKVDTYSGSDKHLKDSGIYEVRTGAEGEYFQAESSNSGAVVKLNDEPTRFVLKKWSTGWSLAHERNVDNHVSWNYNGNGKLMLRRFNAGGRGLKDQMWKLESTPSDRVEIGFPKGVFRMTTKAAEDQGLLLNSDPLTLKSRADSAGMKWKAVPHSDREGYFFLTSEALPKLALEAADGKETPPLMTTHWAAGTRWKAVPADEGYYYLTPATMEDLKYLDGNVGQAQGATARFQGKPFMVDKGSAGPSALWKFIPAVP